MSGLPEQPFNEHEQRFFLAEILKTSAIAPHELLRIIQEREIQPRWTAMALPPGRSIDSCMSNFHQMLGFRAPLPGPGPQYEFLSGAAHSPRPRKKRPSIGQGQGHGQPGGNVQPIQAHPGASGSMAYAQTPAGADMPIQARPSVPDPSMQPQFSHFAAVNESPTSGAYQAGQEIQGYGSDKKSKKRGRPSKADLEVAAAQAQARGEPWPPVKKSRKSGEGVAGPGEGVDASSTKKKAARKPKQKPTPAESAAPGGPAPAAQMTTSAPSAESPTARGKQPLEAEGQTDDKMQVDTPERQPRSTIPETQISEFPAPESLLAGMQEQAAQSAQAAEAAPHAEVNDPQTAPTQTETLQSSATLQQEPAPHTEE